MSNALLANLPVYLGLAATLAFAVHTIVPSKQAFWERYGQGTVMATLKGAYDAITTRSVDRSLPPDLSLAGITCAVTGASRGLGLAIATQLAARGANMVVLCRSRLDETVAHVQRVAAEAGHDSKVLGVAVDLEAIASVDAAVERIVQAGVKVDRLVLNAGMLPAASRVSPDGLDVMLQVNWLGNARLVQRALASGALAPPHKGGALPRVVVVGSEAHRASPPLDLAVLSPGAPPWTYGIAEVVSYYGRSKLFVHTWACELARREEARLEVQHLCPGAVATDIGREAPGWAQPLLRLVFALGFQSPARAAVPPVWCAASPDAARRNGRYLHLTRDSAASALATDPAAGAALWAATDRLLAHLAPAGGRRAKSPGRSPRKR